MNEQTITSAKMKEVQANAQNQRFAAHSFLPKSINNVLYH
jgi:hypothetical protein